MRIANNIITLQRCLYFIIPNLPTICIALIGSQSFIVCSIEICTWFVEALKLGLYLKYLTAIPASCMRCIYWDGTLARADP